MSINIHYYTYCIDDSILFLSMVTFFRSKVIVCSICTIQKSLINFDYQTCELIVNANDSMIQIKIFFILQCTKILWTLLLIFETKLLRWIYFPDLSVCWFMLSGLTEFESFLHEEWRWFGRWFRLVVRMVVTRSRRPLRKRLRPSTKTSGMVSSVG